MSATAARVGHGIASFLIQAVFFALVTIATLVWGWVGLAVVAVVSFVVQFFVRRAFAVARAKQYPPKRDPGLPLRWTPRVSVGGILSGLALGIGGAMILQQFGLAVFDVGRLIQALVAGLLVGIIVPSLLWAVTVARYNARLRRTSPVRAAAGMSVVTVLAWIVVGASGMLGLDAGAASPARADLSGSCEMSVNGQSLAELTVANPVIVADRDATIAYSFTKPSGITSGWGGLTYMGANIPVFSQGDDDVDPDGDGAGVETGVLPIGQLLNAGTGLYEGRLEWSFADGSSCSGSVVFDLLGDPLSTPLGAGAAALVAGGLVGLLAGAGGSGAGAHTALRRTTAVTVSAGAAASGPATPPGVGTRTVVLSGAEARAALERMRASGQGAVIELPESERWDFTADTEGRSHREGWVGTHGAVMRVGAVIEGDDGEITISLDVTPSTSTGDPSAHAAEPPEPSEPVDSRGPDTTAPEPRPADERPESVDPPDAVSSTAPAEGDVADSPAPTGTPPTTPTDPDATASEAESATTEAHASAPAAPGAAGPPGSAATEPPPPPAPDPSAAPSAEVTAALEELRASVPHSLRPVVDYLEPLITSGAREATIPASLLDLPGVDIRDGYFSYDLGFLDVRIAPAVGQDGGLSAEASAVVYGIEAEVPSEVLGLLDDGLAGVNAVLRDAGVTLTDVTVDSAGVHITGAST
ncbi:MULTISPECIES: hypothetical protein [Microcella]|uniref:hypothetical protein n=1 Tax=Microcella TaxID=337004 RepID=UPI0015CF285C|nr:MULTISPECIES: hypothetical protein [Microcella]QOD94091.1 hypothetical protein IE160_02335 [Chryseoglobus sp. 28M-23]